MGADAQIIAATARRNLGTPKPTSHSRRLEALGQVSFDVSEAELKSYSNPLQLSLTPAVYPAVLVADHPLSEQPRPFSRVSVAPVPPLSTPRPSLRLKLRESVHSYLILAGHGHELRSMGRGLHNCNVVRCTAAAYRRHCFSMRGWVLAHGAGKSSFQWGSLLG